MPSGPHAPGGGEGIIWPPVPIPASLLAGAGHQDPRTPQVPLLPGTPLLLRSALRGCLRARGIAAACRLHSCTRAAACPKAWQEDIEPARHPTLATHPASPPPPALKSNPTPNRRRRVTCEVSTLPPSSPLKPPPNRRRRSTSGRSGCPPPTMACPRCTCPPSCRPSRWGPSEAHTAPSDCFIIFSLSCHLRDTLCAAAWSPAPAAPTCADAGRARRRRPPKPPRCPCSSPWPLMSS